MASNSTYGPGIRTYVNIKNPNLAHELKYNDVDSIKSSNFNPNKLTKIIIHGWADGASEVQIGDWLIFMRDAYLRFADINYIVVDYAIYASWFLFFSARPELVGERVAEMIIFLEKQGMQLDPLHIVGWSWGAHIAGMAGHRLNGRIGRVTGIDPAGPTFKYIPNELRLDKRDAKFVDIIHVNGGYPSTWGFFGLPDPLGHLDFYPNGEAAGVQIGCPAGQALVYESLWCSHGRGVKYFTESIFSPLAFPACRCDSFDEYVTGLCPCSQEETSFMGEHLSHNAYIYILFFLLCFLSLSLFHSLCFHCFLSYCYHSLLLRHNFTRFLFIFWQTTQITEALCARTRGIYQLFTRPKPLFGHGIQLNITLPNYTPPEEEFIATLNDTEQVNVRPGTIRIQREGIVTRLEFKDSYNSKSYPNNDIVTMSIAFVLNNTINSAQLIEHKLAPIKE
ncbi:pancreatic triacylglycerol lipase isoform X2 [Folsomia candida]|uniref:pancreatic triacylglycerol lipase isoform X2 n=1 Tax=Folsomia candida TaxID=158441 RepID=UPI001604C812|nr:pancreatic triacylglycerol lipase isoform X2 [Folsomia candida]